jgi:TPP-dependent pyruvate/acetoin dehydrogenase alpha subunit
MTAEEHEGLDEAIITQMDATVDFAESSAEPAPEHRFRWHYVEED